MLLVPTELRPSSIHGIGVFLLAPVKKGDVVWHFDSRLDKLIGQPEFESFPEPIRHFIEIYAPWNAATGSWILYGDHSRYCNHSPDPALIAVGDYFTGDDVASRDLAIGDELTADYNDCYDNKDVMARMGLR